MSDCNHDCSSCGETCSSRTKSFLKEPHAGTHVGRVIAVASGKGGVGKSLVASLLAVRAAARGYRVGLLDADITGPSIPKAFGVAEPARGDGESIFPVTTEGGIKLMSMNCLLEHEGDPVVWRGALIAGAVLQFWTDVAWGDLDYLFIDMPPGTGDVPLTVFQSLPVSGIVIVTTPQDLVEMIVSKAVKMAEMMHVPVVGLVENMSYFECPDCGTRHEIFGKSKVEELKEAYHVRASARMPISPALSGLVGAGKIEAASTDELADVFSAIEQL